jgi:hypothetical protein
MSLPVPARIPTATLTSVQSKITSETLVPANEFRTQLTIFNDSTANLFIGLGLGVTTTNFSIKIAAGGYFELAGGSTVFSGPVSCIWSAANGFARVTEY